MTQSPPPTSTHPTPDQINRVRTFIDKNWAETVRCHTKDEGTLIGLPFPYTIPCRKDAFQELYYWDTYFTCLGLLESGRNDLALNNANNLLSLLDRYGYVPNGNRTYYLTRSQPPYLAPLFWHLSSALKDDSIARKVAPSLQREYEFWTTRRITPTGLSRYGHNANRQELLDFFPEIVHRGGLTGRKAEDCVEETGQLMSECEVGWDLSPRFGQRCGDYCPVDLNSLLYIYEQFLAEFSDQENHDLWLKRAADRKAKLTEFCWDEERGGFFDYNYINAKRSEVVPSTALHPLWSGLATPTQAKRMVEKIMPKIELAHGIAACAPGKRDRTFGWDYPNGWPCVQNLVYRGLEIYGFHEEARRIAGKYVSTVTRCFEETGDLWEKYNVVDGTTRTPSETGYVASVTRDFDRSDETVNQEISPAMMGWTAGVFLDAVAFLEQQAKPLGHQARRS